ncbi:MAG TPA: 5'/3'-nucleotidase SurE [Pseudonocardiaceae bacterium]|jgi:5'-nucleotidase|nr:5'/3'-nucleotidase SurE [Pseudonocardiaceae bacterium]
MTAGPWLALVTNDDGIDAAGLAVLAAAARDAGLQVVVAAPIREASGTSAGLTATEDGGGRVLIEDRELPGLPDIRAHAVAAHPAFIVLAAAQGAFGPAPDVVLSGVNEGANIGRAVLHSGTVGAALTGALQGARAMAVSLAVGPEPHDPRQWDSARAVLRTVLPLVAELPPGTTLNLNVPDRPLERLGELRPVPLARVGTVQTRIEQLGGHQLRRVTAPLPGDPEPGTDAAVLAAGHPTVSELRSVDDANPTALPKLLPHLPGPGAAW